MPEAFRAGSLAVVTGAASGIGEALARKAREQGMQLLLSDIDEVKLEKVARALEADFLVCDVSDPSAVEALAARAEDAPSDIGAVFANAGVMKTKPLVKTTPEDWTFMIGVNLIGVANMVRSFTPRLTAQQEASRFVATASVAGLVSAPLTGALVADSPATSAVRFVEYFSISRKMTFIGALSNWVKVVASTA